MGGRGQHPAKGTGANSLLSYTDTAASTAPIAVAGPTTIATAPAGTAWRGVAFAPTGWHPSAASGGPTPADAPTIAAGPALALALGDGTNPATTVDVAPGTGSSATPGDLTVTATASTAPSVAGVEDVMIGGTGGTRQVSVTPRGVGKTTITLTVTDPTTDTTATTGLVVGVSGDPTGLDTPVYHDGSADGSTVIDVGDGYMLVADDEDSVIRLYRENRSGAAVASWDFTADLGSGEADLEASARVGDTIYWSGSMSNSKAAVYQASRNIVFATTISGSGANVSLAYAGRYAGLRDELITWDHARGDALGLATACAETAPTTLPDVTAGCNLEGLEFAPGSAATAYLGMRAPVVQGKAVVIPVTNYPELIGATRGSARFGDPILLDLGGRSIRELRQGVGGQYLITAGAPDDAAPGLGWALYRWNGVAGSAPVPVAAMPSDSGAAGQEAGSWESIVSVPTQLAQGTRVQLLTDNGTTVFYGDGVAGKDVSPMALQRSVSSWITLGAVPDEPATVSDSTIVAGQPVTVSGSGFTPGESVDVVLHSAPVTLATVRADSRGTVSATVTIPPSAAAGAHTLLLVGERSGVTASAAVRIIADPALASTGTDMTLPAAAALLLVLGVVVVLLRRRAA